MSVLSVRNLQETFIGKNIARTASAQVTDPNATGYIADGEIVVVNSAGVVYDTSMTNITSPWIQIVQRNGDNLVWSSKINYNKLVALRGRAFSFGQEQIYHIGYTGSANSLDITAGLDFQLTIVENQDDMMWAEQKKKNVTSVPNNLVTSQQDLAKAIVKNVMKKYTTDGLSVTAAMLNSGSAATASGTATTTAVVHGSNVIVPNGTMTNVAAGSVLRLGATGSGRGTTVPVYTVQGAHPTITNAWILDQPYAGPSNSTLSVTADAGLVTAGASWGVRFTGKALPFRRDFFKFKRTSFTLQMSGFGATPITKTQEMGYGYGDGRLVLEEESFSKGFQGALNRMSVPLPLANETFTADGSVSNTVGATAAATISNGAAYSATGAFVIVTTSAAHGFVVGQTVVIAGTTGPTNFNGTFQIVAVPSTTTFTVANALVTAGTGTTTTAGTATPSASTNGDIYPTSATNYSTLTLEHYTHVDGVVVSSADMPQLVKIMIPAGASQGWSGISSVQQALNDWAVGALAVM